MGSKLAFLLSLFFIVGLMGMAGDLASIQAIQTSLDAASITAAKAISLRGGIDQELIATVKEECGAKIYPLDEQVSQVGDIYRFRLTKEYRPFVISTQPVIVQIERSTIIGYLD